MVQPPPRRLKSLKCRIVDNGIQLIADCLVDVRNAPFDTGNRIILNRHSLGKDLIDKLSD